MILARAFVLDDGTLVNSDRITAPVGHPSAGIYDLTVDLTGVELPAGTDAADLRVFATPQRAFAPGNCPKRGSPTKRRAWARRR